jgi:hypothetical protein
MNKLISSKVYSLFVIIISLYLSLHLFKYKSNLTTKRSLLYSFNHTFSISFPKSTTWIPSIPREKSIKRDPNEKYLTFFTHSGFQNQLIQG